MNSQIEIAKHINISPGALSNIINGRRRPSWSKAKLLAAATKTTPELWLEGTPEQIRNALKSQQQETRGAE